MITDEIVVFTEEERKQLSTIAGDKFSIGAFSGMLYNAKLAHPEQSIDSLIKLSLHVRNRIIELGGTYKYELDKVEEKVGEHQVTINKFKRVKVE